MDALTDFQETWNNLQDWSDDEMKILDDHVGNMLFKIQNSGDNEAIKYWSDLGVLVKSTIKERALAV